MEKPEKPAPPKMTYASVRLQRLTALGGEASVVGFLWVGYILGGAGIGYFLDAHFHTSFLTPALLLFGAVEGFREMMVTVSRLNKNPKPNGASSGTMADNRQIKHYEEYPAVDETPGTAAPASSQRIFQVPAPPQPSFTPGPRDVKASASTLSRSVNKRPETSEPQTTDSSSEDLIKQLLNEHPDSSQ